METLYKHILVTLDGSESAEVAVPHALGLAKLSGAEVTLLFVEAPVEYALQTLGQPIYVDEHWETRKARAQQYLDSIARRPECRGLRIRSAVEMGPAAETILDYAFRNSVDLIVMATHGRSGLKRWVLGSVADKVLRAADRSVLLVRAYPGQGAKSTP